MHQNEPIEIQFDPAEPCSMLAAPPKYGRAIRSLIDCRSWANYKKEETKIRRTQKKIKNSNYDLIRGRANK